jgi:diguanylate cyclase (GGDEF)-like protein
MRFERPKNAILKESYFDQRLASETSVARRHGHAFSLIMADIDRFKSINDQHGHPFGDQLLRHVAHVLSSCCRSEDVVCRYGGEEFAILAPMTSIDSARIGAKHFRHSIYEQTIQHRGADVRISASFGVAQLGLSLGESEALIERADAALYRAKHSGRNCVVCADMHQCPPLEEARPACI